ncbi:hypothetical protein HY251_03475 [bacterium]|nr:hypothetical protein [bacterium]
MTVSAWEPSCSGAYIDIDDRGKDRVRFAGLSYQGALLDQRLQALARKLPASDLPLVFMLHADPDWTQAPEGTVLSSAAKEALRARVGYLALGHRHEKRSREGWIWNPGSLEATHVGAGESPPERGFWDVTVARGKFTATYIESECRALRVVRAKCDGAASDEAVLEAARRALDGVFLKGKPLPASLPESDLRRPIVCVSLVGRTNFASRLLDERALEDALRAHPALVAAQPLMVEVRNRTIPPGMIYVEGDEDGRATGDELQRQIELVLTAVAEQYPVAGVPASEVARLSRRIKACTEDLEDDKAAVPGGAPAAAGDEREKKRPGSASDRLLARVRHEIQAVLG